MFSSFFTFVTAVTASPSAAVGARLNDSVTPKLALMVDRDRDGLKLDARKTGERICPPLGNTDEDAATPLNTAARRARPAPVTMLVAAFAAVFIGPVDSDVDELHPENQSRAAPASGRRRHARADIQVAQLDGFF